LFFCFFVFLCFSFFFLFCFCVHVHPCRIWSIVRSSISGCDDHDLHCENHLKPEMRYCWRGLSRLKQIPSIYINQSRFPSLCESTWWRPGKTNRTLSGPALRGLRRLKSTTWRPWQASAAPVKIPGPGTTIL
jgi:hypothetical protein